MFFKNLSIEKAKSEAIIIPSNSVGALFGTSFLKSISVLAGDGLKRELKNILQKNKKPFSIGECFSTDSFELSKFGFKKLYFSVMIETPNDIISFHNIEISLKNSLKLAIEEKTSSVAIPYFGDSVSVLDKKIIADRMYSVLRNFNTLIDIGVVSEDSLFIKEIRAFDESWRRGSGNRKRAS